MKIKILKGTNQIGGCITEIKSNHTSIIIDFGADLPKRNTKQEIVNPLIKGLTYGDSAYDAVFITHNHQDHLGLFNYVNHDIPVYLEPINKKIYQILNDFTKTIKLRATTDMIIGKPITIKDMTITPHIVDHSAFNSVMLLIESDGKRILHTGDFRGHGYKGKILLKIIKEIGIMDCVITEGTSLSRDDKETYITEQQLSDQAVEIMQQYKQVFVLQSTTNIDRLTAMYKACIKTNKVLIEDILMANITALINKETGNKIPNPITFKNVSVYIPLNRLHSNDKAFRIKYIQPLLKFKDVKKLFLDYTMNIRISMLKYLKKLKDKGSITNACLIYSMWEGYKEEESVIEFLKEVDALGITIIDLHTSGHADIRTIKKVMELLNPRIIIPIHTTNKSKIKELFKTAVILEDNEEMGV